LNPYWTLYGDWGVGFKSGGFNNAGSAATIDAFINPVRTNAGYAPVNISDTFKKEVSTQGEIGAKGRLLDGRLTLTPLSTTRASTTCSSSSFSSAPLRPLTGGH
jgi:outer membrane receptor protein involved in Fe transport